MAMTTKHLLINLETKAVTGINVREHTYEFRYCYFGTPVQQTVAKGEPFNTTNLAKEEIDTFKEIVNELIKIHDRQTLDEEMAKYQNSFRAALSIPPLTINVPDSYFNHNYCSDHSVYCKADVDLIKYADRMHRDNILPASEIRKIVLPSLDKIYINPDKEIVTAKKDNDEIIKVQTSHGDEFDPYIGAALAYCYKQFGSKAAFRKAVDKITPKPKKKKKVVKHDVFPETGTDAIEDLRKGIEDFGNFVSSLSDAIRGGDLSVKIIDDNDKIWKKIDGEMVECEVFKQDTYEVGDEVLLNKDSPWCPGWVVTVDTRCCAYSPKDNASTVYHVTTLDMNEKLLVYPKHIAGKVVPKK